MHGQDVVGQDLGGPGGGGEQADGALDGVGRQGRARAGDVDELGHEEDDDVDAGPRAGDGQDGAAQVDAHLGKAPLDGAQDLVVGAQEGHGGEVGGQDEAAGGVGGSGAAGGIGGGLAGTVRAGTRRRASARHAVSPVRAVRAGVGRRTGGASQIVQRSLAS